MNCLRQLGVAWEQIKSYQLLLLLEPEYSTNPYAYQYDKILEQIKDLVDYAEEYHQIYLNLADDKSKDIFLKMILFRLTYDVRMHYGNATKYAHYFDEDIISLNKQEIFVDCGGYMGDTLEEFKKVYDNQFKRYYLFEPDPELFHIAVSKGDDRVEFINKGVWKEETTLSFRTETANGNGMVLEGMTDYETIEIMVTNLDDNIEEATFIKMDVEGSELNALIGAQNLIRKCHPKLAVCVYHKYEDFRKLYEYINELGKYSVYLRAEMDNVDTETYYLCIPQKEE